jgi:hypothetical protein
MANSGIKIQVLHDNFSAFVGVILSSGEPAYAIDNGVFKVGDGITTWESLPNINLAISKIDGGSPSTIFID